MLFDLHDKYTITQWETRQNYGIMNKQDKNIYIYIYIIIESDVHYKPTNSHQYLNYGSFHPLHCKNNIPFNLAKRIIVFVTCSEKMEFRLRELKLWLLKCNYPETIIDKGFHNARLQGPAPKPISKNNIIPFVTTYTSNLDTKPMMNSIRTLISDKKFGQLNNVFKDANVVVGYKQPKSLAKLLTRAKFSNTKLHKTESISDYSPGIFAACKDSRCNLCHNNYIQECSSFKAANGEIWEIKAYIDCNSKNVLYYLTCNMCNGAVTYTGRTKNKLRTRTNNHISCCRSGKGSNIFDNHVFNCGTKNNCLKPPYFKVYAFTRLSKEDNLPT